MTTSYIEHLDIDRFQQDLIQWYEVVKRDLPWRKNKDPYGILVSEIMLQQTQVVTVIPYYQRFMTLFPTTKALAEADEATLLKAWEGLGYYSRVRNLQESARMVEARGGFPTTHEEILKLKGVGPYTAGAVGSIAFGLAVPAVDGNVFRVMSRICCIFEDVAKAKTRKVFEAVVQDVISHQHPSEFNQGLMELGATVCTPKSPKCSECPLQQHCQAYEKGIDDLLPVKSKANQQKRIQLVVGLIRNQHGEFLMEKRSEQGLLANFYEFKTFEYAGPLEPKEFLSFELTKLGATLEAIESIGSFNHIFSHRIWEMEAYFASVHIEDRGGLWISQETLRDYPLVVAHERILKNLENCKRLDFFGES